MLDTQLDAYDYRLRTRRKAKLSRQELMAYSAAALGATIAAPEVAFSAVVHNTTPLSFPVTGTWISSGLGIDLDGVGGNDWSFRMAGYNMPPAYGWVIGIGTGGEVSSGSDAQQLAPGFMIGNTLSAGQWNTANDGNGAAIFAGHAFPASATNYLGVRFQGDTGTVGTQYAWLKVRLEWTPGIFQLKFKVLEWAYDDSGAPIAVGSVGGTPPTPSVPVSVSVDDFAPLTLLGLGAVGLAAFRRRRDKALAEGKAKH